MQLLDTVFTFLFKYRPIVFEKGRLALSAPWPLIAVFLAVAAAALVVLATYARARRGDRRDQFILTALRASALGLLFFALSRPMLLVPTVVPQRNFLGILIDDSRSMRIADDRATARADVVRAHLGAPDSALYAALAERFQLRFYRFAGEAERIDGLDGTTFDGRVTDLAAALDYARRDLAALPVAGLIVFSDGADNAESSLGESLLALNARSIPVYSVGIGRSRYDQDVEVIRVETPERVLRGSSLVVDVHIRQAGYRRERVTLNVEESGRIVTSESVTLPGNDETARVRVQFEVQRQGAHLYRFHIPPLEGEQVTENNTRESLIVVEDRREKILYVEGEPRFELKFIRRAVADDENLQVVSLQRTAKDKFYRLDVDDAEELESGFPQTREELFAYRGLILGSIEAGFFTHDQLRMIDEFVSQRGGGILFLGGRHAFVEGGYAGTPVASAMPVELDAAAGEEPFFAELRVEPTRFGLDHPSIQIAPSFAESARRWRSLPAVTAINDVSTAKPGATVLLTGTPEGSSQRHIVLAFQRYGRGMALALPIQDSWMWQMHAEITVDDLTHETFWRQLLRWLVSNVPEPVVAEVTHELASPETPLELRAEVQDETYLRVNNAEVVATVIDPSGSASQVSMGWDVERDGAYRAQYTPRSQGPYEVRVEAQKGGRFIGSGSTYFYAKELATEFFDSEMRRELLTRIADETGGRFYTPANVSSLPEDVSVTHAGTTVVDERDLWDMPIIFLLLVTLVGAEWGYRRRRGLV